MEVWRHNWCTRLQQHRCIGLAGESDFKEALGFGMFDSATSTESILEPMEPSLYLSNGFLFTFYGMAKTTGWLNANMS